MDHYPVETEDEQRCVAVWGAGKANLLQPQNLYLTLSPLGAPVIFVLNGHEAMTAETANWTKYSIKNPHLTIWMLWRIV